MLENFSTEYSELIVGSTRAVVRQDVRAGVEEILRRGFTVHGYAATQPNRESFQGRVLAHTLALNGDAPQLLVRHSQHGGIFAPLTRDLFFGAARAMHELIICVLLTDRGVPTPGIAGYVKYRAGVLSRIDVLVDLVPNTITLADALGSSASGEDRVRALAATQALLASLANAQAVHPDLNARNVLVARCGSPPVAYALDVDRVILDRTDVNSTRSLNRRRLLRSLAKLKRHGTLTFDAAEIEALDQ